MGRGGRACHDGAMRVSPLRQRLLGNVVSRTVLSAWAWLLLGVLLILWVPLVFVVWAVTVPFDKGRYWPGWLFRKVCVVHQVLNPLWSFRTSGEKVSDPRRPYMVVANHESFVDMLLLSHLPWEMKWLSKEDFFKYPMVGWLMRMAGDIKLVRGNRESIVSAMKGMRDRLGKRVSVMVFPEGTRTLDGTMGEFKDGAFRIAIEAQVPILPLAVVGTREALNKGDWRMNVTRAEVRVLEPIDTSEYTKHDVAKLRDLTRERIVAAVAEMKAGGKA